jgi:hypothetical protein
VFGDSDDIIRFYSKPMQVKTKKVLTNGGGTVTAAAAGPTAIVTVGGGTSASAITSGLALIGGGTMLGGIAVVSLGSVGIFFMSRWVYRKLLRT